MPIIRVELFKGRDREKKRAIAKALTDAFVNSAGGKPEAVTIVFKDVDKEDWAVAGALMVDKLPD